VISAQPTTLRWLLVLPFLAPLVALAISAAVERGTVEVLAEQTQGRLVLHRGTHRVVLFAIHTARAWVYDLDGRKIGELKASGSTKMVPLVAGSRVLFIGEQRAVVGRLPLDGGEVAGVEHELPAPVAAEYLHAYFPFRLGTSPIAFACPDVTLIHTAAGWVSLSRQGSRAVPRPPSGCRAMESLGYRPEIPIPSVLSLETRLDGDRTAVVGAAYGPVSYVLGVTPDRDRLLWVAPPKEEPTLGTALVSGCWVLLAGRHCRLGELRLTLGCLTDPPGRPYRFSKLLFRDSSPVCQPDHVPAASICDDQLQLELPEGIVAWQLDSGARTEPRGRCTPMRRLQSGRPARVSGQALRMGKVLYRIDARELSTSVGGAVDWVASLPAAGHILGATDDHLLVQLAPDRLHVLARRDGSHVRTARIAELHDPIENRPSLAQWIGHVGKRAYFLLVRSQRWRQRIRETHLMMYDGERVRVVD
jgi:hypothetical protein